MESLESISPNQLDMHNLERLNQETCRLAGTVTRMMTTFQQGMVTLQRMRTGGRQEVLVQHVTVRDGGQAVVAGQVTPSGRGPRRKARHSKNEE